MEEIAENRKEEAVNTQPEAISQSANPDSMDFLSLVMEQRVHNQKMQRLMKITAGCMIGILAVVVLAAALTLPRVIGILSDAQEITAQVQEMAEQAEGGLTDTREVVAQVKEADPQKVMESVNSLAKEGEKALQECTEQVTRAVDILDRMDIDSLNTAVDNLGKAIAPLAKFFGGR